MSAPLQRPFIYMNMAMTADGKITSGAREYPRFTSTFDRSTMDRLRSEADAVLIGAGTLRHDDPSLQVRDAGLRAERRALGKPEWLTTIVVSASLDLRADCAFFTAPAERRIVVTCEAADAQRAAALRPHADIWRLGGDTVDLPAVVTRLAAEGIQRLLVEGGAELNWAFLAADLFDELYITLAPVLLGGATAPTIIGGAGLSMDQQRRLRLIDLHREGDELYCHYALQRSGARRP